MSENTNANTAKSTPAKKTSAKKTTATKKVAEQSKEIITSDVAEATTNDDGQEVITGPKKVKSSPVSNNKTNDEGIIGSRAADKALVKEEIAQTDRPVVTKKAPAKKKEDDKVLLWSKKNVRWQGVGSLSSGYNVVTKEAADKWLERRDIREASAEEVKTYYGT
jgi:hypothetical protein